MEHEDLLRRAVVANMPGVRVCRPEGASDLCLDLPVDDANSFATFLLPEFSLGGETVMVTPFDGLYAPPEPRRDEVRVGYVLECDRLARAMRILEAALAAYPSRVTA